MKNKCGIYGGYDEKDDDDTLAAFALLVAGCQQPVVGGPSTPSTGSGTGAVVITLGGPSTSSGTGSAAVAEPVEARTVVPTAPAGAGGDYATLADAIAASSAGTADNPFVINVTGNLDIAAVLTIASGKHIKLVSTSGTTLKRLGTAASALFFVQSGGSLTIGSGVTVDGNKGAVNASGSLVYVNGGAFTLEAGATLKDNANGGFPGGGGGVFVQGGTFTMKGGAISGNSAGNGGGVYVAGGSFIMQGGAISGNSTNTFGGGVCVDNSGTFTLEGGTVYGSTAGGGLANTADYGGAALYKAGFGTAVFGANGGSVGGDPRVGGSAIDTTNETLVGAGA
ncbi:MAG: hypothetical protein LBS64_06490 [Spirochaetaceae bacterium]|jgi:hypothetical protein|nr:hypothetical protein [Spirochaetaceae bacterium]